MNYDASAIRVLKGLEGVRHRPAMYIGGTGVEGYHHLFKEILDNAVDEALAGYATEILVRLNEDGSLTVEDNGRGIPVDLMPEEGKPAVEVIYTTLHSGASLSRAPTRSPGAPRGGGERGERPFRVDRGGGLPGGEAPPDRLQPGRGHGAPPGGGRGPQGEDRDPGHLQARPRDLREPPL